MVLESVEEDAEASVEVSATDAMVQSHCRAIADPCASLRCGWDADDARWLRW
jgi:hypothetical protein